MHVDHPSPFPSSAPCLASSRFFRLLFAIHHSPFAIRHSPFAAAADIHSFLALPTLVTYQLDPCPSRLCSYPLVCVGEIACGLLGLLTGSPGLGSGRDEETSLNRKYVFRLGQIKVFGK